jgi:hypothetical protein
LVFSAILSFASANAADDAPSDKRTRSPANAIEKEPVFLLIFSLYQLIIELQLRPFDVRPIGAL